MRVAIVLLTGGEPFARKDLPEIIKAFESRGVHVRMQTNGFASEDQIIAAIEAGGHDISISLDTLKPLQQDKINGGYIESWHRALKSISLFTKYLPKNGSFASLGCVLQPYNLGEIEDVIRFGSEISWYTSLVPIHVTNHSNPRGFRTFDQNLKFKADEFKSVDKLLKNVRVLRNEGHLLYDSDQYLDDIGRFIRDPRSSTWREKNENICDSPNLYFALLPNGEFAPCCDFRLDNHYPAYDLEFPKIYNNVIWRKKVEQITKSCDGCMYGSYPEITISMRYLAAKYQRLKTFMAKPIEKNWPLTYEELLDISDKILASKRERLLSRGEGNLIPIIDSSHAKENKIRKL